MSKTITETLTCDDCEHRSEHSMTFTMEERPEENWAVFDKDPVCPKCGGADFTELV